MNFNDILNHDDRAAQEVKPEMSHQRSSINILLNTESTTEPTEDAMRDSPALHSKASFELLKRNSIASITNDNDIDIDGNKTLNTARRVSFSSDSASPLQAKAKLNADGARTVFKKPHEEYGAVDISRDDDDDDYDDSEIHEQLESDILEIEDEVKFVEKKKAEVLRNSTLKPKKYIEPPIWAAEWIPPKKSKPQRSLLQLPTRYPDLENSITGKTPYEDLSRRVGEWIYANFEQIPDEEYRFIELEAKLGRIWNKETDSRIELPLSTECVITDVINYFFEPGVEEPQFNELNRFLADLERQNKRGNKKFITLNYKNEDRFYKDKTKGSGIPRSIRVTKDSESRRETAIEKKRVSDLFIHLPNSIVDLRLSLSLELPVDVPLDKFEKQKPLLTRLKTRSSYYHKPTCTTFDLTRVNTVSSKGPKISHEVELEIEVPQLLDSYLMVKEGVDNFRYEEVIKIFLDNSRIVAREVSKKII